MTLKRFPSCSLAAKALLHRLVEEKPKVLVQDWVKDRQSRLIVQSAVEEVLDKTLPETYDKDSFQQKCKVTFNLIYDYASRGLKWAG